jgi:hypothetical protein
MLPRFCPHQGILPRPADLLGFPMVLETPELMGCLIGLVFVGFGQGAPVHPADTT